MIETLARAAVDRLLTSVVAAAADELPADVRIEREGDAVALIGPRVKLQALTDARIVGLFLGRGRR